MSLLLITSGSYIEPAMQNEFGRIPPSLLPLGGKTLLEQQVANLNDIPNDRLISIPDNYEVPKWMNKIIQSLNFKISYTQQNLSLGESIIQALNQDGRLKSGLQILHGDTLISGLSLSAEDLVSVHVTKTPGYWARAVIEGNKTTFIPDFIENSNARSLSGYFSFSSTEMFLRALEENKGDFIAALNYYNLSRKLEVLSDNSWYDFGRLQSYYHSRGEFTTERHFNRIVFSRETVRKESFQKEKIKSESYWYENIPAKLKLYTPRIIDSGALPNRGYFYEMEHLKFCTLSELFVFCDVPLTEWQRIIESCVSFLQLCRQYEGSVIAQNHSLYRLKTYERVGEYCRSQGIETNSNWIINGYKIGSLNHVIEFALEFVKPSQVSNVMHGDFCFSNIHYDQRFGLIRPVDPRGGIDPSNPSVFGDKLYDVGKLYHSFLGYYDLILAGHYQLSRSKPYEFEINFDLSNKQQKVSEMFEMELKSSGLITGNQGVAISVLLFLSMIPLHSDRPDRQIAFLANALRLAKLLLVE